jgi:MoaA/NifB/PqqE/SkfB family radical SAM enzyme
MVAMHSYLKYLAKVIKGWVSWYSHNPSGPPEHAQLIVTNMCNGRCKHCNIWKKYNDHPELLKEELSSEEIFRLVDELEAFGVSTMSISGGEPLLRQDIFSIIEKIKKTTSIQLNITTNGILLNEKVSRKLVELGLDSINISLDGMEEVHNKIRGLTIFSRIFHQIKKMERVKEGLGSSKPMISISSVMTASNMHSIIELNDFLKKNTSCNHGFGSLVSTGEVYYLRNLTTTETTNTSQPSDGDLSRFIAELKKRDFNLVDLKYFEFTRKYNNNTFRFPSFFHPCLAGLFNIVITETGNVLPCCTWYNGGVVDNIRRKSLHQIWYSPEFRMKRKAIFQRKCPSCWISTYSVTSTRILPSMILSTILSTIRMRLLGR